jgi:iron complex transport system ATP-binding protein
MNDINIDELSFQYDGNSIINNINASIKSQDIVSIIGPNGSGKTTLLKLIAGILTPQSGNVLLSGSNIQKIPAKIKSKLITLVPQNPEYPENMRVFDYVMLGRNPYLTAFKWENSADKKMIREIMSDTNTLKFIDRKLNEVSGGEKQRISLALAMAQGTRSLLLDEPLSNLDISNQAVIMQLIVKNHHERLGPTILSIHDLTIAAQYSDRVILLDDGNLVAYGTPDSVLTQQNINKVFNIDVAILTNPNNGNLIISTN